MAKIGRGSNILKWAAVILLSAALGFAVAHAEDCDYDRANWKHWTDRDGDGFSARDEVLLEENVGTVLALESPGRKKVLKGAWLCPYTGEVFTDPRKLDVDHFRPLGHTAHHGGCGWSDERKELYANFLSHPDHLVAVKAGANRSKGARGPGEWMPPDESAHCWYAKTWIDIGLWWNLCEDELDLTALRAALETCEEPVDVDELFGLVEACR